MLHQSLDCPVCRSPDTSHFQSVRGREYYRCGSCEATFLSPAQLPTPNEEHAQYETHENDVEDPGYRAFLDRLAGPLLSRLPAPATGLDFGCGPAPALAHMLREAGHHVRCYDPFYAPDTAPLTDSYDFITATEVVEHLHDPAGTFELFESLLRPGGILGVMTEFLTDDSRFAGWHYRRDISHVVFYCEQTLRDIAGRFGWEIEIPRKNVSIFTKHGRPRRTGRPDGRRNLTGLAADRLGKFSLDLFGNQGADLDIPERERTKPVDLLDCF